MNDLSPGHEQHACSGRDETIPCLGGSRTEAMKGFCNIGYPSENNLNIKPPTISFAHKLSLSLKIVLKFCTEHGSDTAVLCAKLQNDAASEMDDWDWEGYDILRQPCPKTIMFIMYGCLLDVITMTIVGGTHCEPYRARDQSVVCLISAVVWLVCTLVLTDGLITGTTTARMYRCSVKVNQQYACRMHVLIITKDEDSIYVNTNYIVFDWTKTIRWTKYFVHGPLWINLNIFPYFHFDKYTVMYIICYPKRQHRRIKVVI